MTRRITALLILIAIAILAVLLFSSFNPPLRHAAPPGFELLPIHLPAQPRPVVGPVVVAVVDLPRGASITPEAVKIKEFPRDLVPAGALSKLEDAVNRVIFVPLTKDEPVLESKLAPKGAGRTVGTDPPWHAGLLGQGAGCGAGRRRLHPARQPG